MCGCVFSPTVVLSLYGSNDDVISVGVASRRSDHSAHERSTGNPVRLSVDLSLQCLFPDGRSFTVQPSVDRTRSHRRHGRAGTSAKDAKLSSQLMCLLLLVNRFAQNHGWIFTNFGRSYAKTKFSGDPDPGTFTDSTTNHNLLTHDCWSRTCFRGRLQYTR